MSDKTAAARISARENGPYKVSNLLNLTNSKGVTLPTEETVALCRCGYSAKKPFCDGSHKAKGFSSENLADPVKDHCDHYRGSNIVIHDNRSICAHAGACTEGLPSVWRMGQEPWIDPDGAEVAAIIEIIERCPSGALTYSLEQDIEPAAMQPGIHVSENGPYHVTGMAFDDAPWGQGASTTRYALCRCGASKNKPFCDGSHWHIGFRDDDN